MLLSLHWFVAFSASLVENFVCCFVGLVDCIGWWIVGRLVGSLVVRFLGESDGWLLCCLFSCVFG